MVRDRRRIEIDYKRLQLVWYDIDVSSTDYLVINQLVIPSCHTSLSSHCFKNDQYKLLSSSAWNYEESEHDEPPNISLLIKYP